MHRVEIRAWIAIGGLLAGLGLTVAPAVAAQARLVHCGAETCLRVSGHRPAASVAVRVRGDVLPVEGRRTWRATVPLAAARGWAAPSGQSLIVELVDARDGSSRSEEVALPPGALGRHVELASLVVSAR